MITREIIKPDAACYSYKFIINRPSRDHGRGIARLGRLQARLY
ncbi:hypothetical protein X474_06335 [Dethiosulfatarculus sandiegensis]|uniref:Uncharacterized protein n=1 Tax=Dethiosulfatarculus sandiegensis TaxID=1429043 RepID=A0A0D2JG95_9BACT|nr:hypothetical protein X474_06335 [Dethiosulfatarculus sandiegensis]